MSESVEEQLNAATVRARWFVVELAKEDRVGNGSVAFEWDGGKGWFRPGCFFGLPKMVDVTAEKVFFCFLGVAFLGPCRDLFGIAGPLPFASWNFEVGDCASVGRFKDMVQALA